VARAQRDDAGRDVDRLLANGGRPLLLLPRLSTPGDVSAPCRCEQTTESERAIAALKLQELERIFN
jgi:hypothetical protein